VIIVITDIIILLGIQEKLWLVFGFKILLDAILLSLARKVYLPDMEILFNLGDWPLVSTEQKPHIPLFSWCETNDTLTLLCQHMALQKPH
jgi:hypothetical protein